jgi:hypothetical protein
MTFLYLLAGTLALYLLLDVLPAFSKLLAFLFPPNQKPPCP